MTGTLNLRGSLSVLRAQLDRELAPLHELRAVAVREARLGGLLEDLDRQLARSRGALVVVVAGPTGSGKSTLVNALVGEQVCIEGVDRPTTSNATVVAPEDADLSALFEGLVGPPPVVLRRAAARGERSREFVVIDAPDVNSVAAEHRATVRSLAERADVVVACLHRQSIVEAATSSFLDAFKSVRRVLWVLSRADEVPDAARDRLAEQLAGVSGASAEDLFTLSATRARAGGDAGFDRLLARLDELAGSGGTLSVRCHNALGAAAAIGREIGAAAQECTSALDELPERLRSGFDLLVDDVKEELDVRLALRVKPIAAQLVAEAGRRWEGPGGFVLRAGSWSAIGAGLGLALARRAPLAAAGLAVGGVAASGARRALERRSLELSTGLLPEPGEIDATWRRRLSEARLATDAVVLSRSAVAFPESDEVASSLESAAREGWQRLIDRDLPLEAERVVPALMRWLCDLPVYALAGWVAWRVVDGFVREQYAGVDFLVNAALIALALLWIVRQLCAGSARLRAKRLVRRVSADVRRALEQRADEAVERVTARVAALQRSADAVTGVEARWRKTLLTRD